MYKCVSICGPERLVASACLSARREEKKEREVGVRLVAPFAPAKHGPEQSDVPVGSFHGRSSLRCRFFLRRRHYCHTGGRQTGDSEIRSEMGRVIRRDDFVVHLALPRLYREEADYSTAHLKAFRSSGAAATAKRSTRGERDEC